MRSPQPVAWLALVALAAAVLALDAATGPSVADGPQPVQVVNFPSPQRVEGRVAVREPPPMSRLERRSAVVGPASLREVNLLTEAGVLDADGFSGAVLSVVGEMKGPLAAPARVGALLVPDEPELLRLFRDEGVAAFALRAEAEVRPGGSGSFIAPQVHARLGFPRYRVFFFDDSPRSAELALFVYLTNG